MNARTPNQIQSSRTMTDEKQGIEYGISSEEQSVEKKQGSRQRREYQNAKTMQAHGDQSARTKADEKHGPEDGIPSKGRSAGQERGSRQEREH